MLLEKKMFGHLPFCCRAASSVPGAPASSLATGSHELVLNSGMEISAPVWVALALLATLQPPDPRLDRSLAPLADSELGPRRPTAARAPPAALGMATCGAACAPGAAEVSSAAADAMAAQRVRRRRMTGPMAGNSYPRPAGRDARCPHISISSYTFQTNLSSDEGLLACGAQLAEEGRDVAGEQLGFLDGSEVAAAGHGRPPAYVVEPLCPFAGW